MKNNLSRSPAQIGIIAVVLTTVLLVIGVSVGTRVTQDAAQNTQRTESTQAVDSAEGNLELINPDGTVVPGTDAQEIITDQTGTTSQVANVTSNNNSILLSEGETVEVTLDDNNLNAQLLWHRVGESCDSGTNSPGLLISQYYPVGNTQEVQYYLLTSHDKTRDGYLTAQIPSGSGSLYQNSTSLSSLTASNPNFPLASGQTLRIKALFCNTTIDLPGLVTITRSASQDSSEEQVRILEQRSTDPTAPAIFDFALFAGQGDLRANY